MAKSGAERMREHRGRQREGVTGLTPVGAGPGEVETALEATLAAMEGPDPAVAASARRLARVLDTGDGVNPAVAAELRRHVGQLQADDRRKAAGKPEKPAKQAQPNMLQQMRAARARSDARRGWARP
jgi:hypothetical protein